MLDIRKKKTIYYAKTWIADNKRGSLLGIPRVQGVNECIWQHLQGAGRG